MKFLKGMVVGALVALTFASGVVAQITGLLPTSYSGNEVWSIAIGGPGGPSTFASTASMRNSTGVQLATLAAPLAVPSTTANVCITAQPAGAANLTLPTPAFDGQIFEAINCTTGAFATNVFSIVPAAGQTLLGGNIALTTLAAGASRELRYVLSTNTWYPLR